MARNQSALLGELLFALTRVYHRLSAASDGLHAEFGLTTGTRAILLLLHHRGKLTLSEIARDRAVSRQFIQRTAAPLLEAKFVTLVANATNRRSPKLQLTEKGTSVVTGILLREESMAAAVANSLSSTEFEIALRVLLQIDATLQPFVNTQSK